MIVGSFSIVGIGMMAAVLPLLYVERGAQMTFVLQSILLLFSGVYYSIAILPQWMQVLSQVLAGLLHPRRRPRRPDRRRARSVTAGQLSGRWLIMAVVLIPLGIFVFGRAEQYAKRTGKLKRVG